MLVLAGGLTAPFRHTWAPGSHGVHKLAAAYTGGLRWAGSTGLALNTTRPQRIHIFGNEDVTVYV